MSKRRRSELEKLEFENPGEKTRSAPNRRPVPRRAEEVVVSDEGGLILAPPTNATPREKVLALLDQLHNYFGCDEHDDGETGLIFCSWHSHG
jgi:hypothetical protein